MGTIDSTHNYSARIRIDAPGLPLFVQGHSAFVDLQIHNSGNFTWPAGGKTPVRVSYHWLALDGSTVVHDGLRAALPYDLPAGQSAGVMARIEAPARAGLYTLQMTLVQEAVCWFDEQGDDPLEASLEVAGSEEYFAAEIRLMGKIPSILYSGEAIRIPLYVTNKSPRTWRAGGLTPLHPAYRWLDSVGGASVTPPRTKLPGDVPPGESRLAIMRVKAPDAAGAYTLQITLVEEGVAWFEDEAAIFSPLEEAVEIRPAASPGSPGRRRHDAEVEDLAEATRDARYTVWIERYDTLHPDTEAVIREQIRSWPNPPLISVLMPVYDPPARFLREAIESVIAQWYPAWELCIADDASTELYVREILQEYAHRDPRIRLCFRERNGHISAASNSALSLARGEFVALLDHDDRLPPHSLYCYAGEIGKYPEVAWIYSDTDKIDSEWKRRQPQFKPDPNPDLFRSLNYMADHGVFRTALAREIGGFRGEFEGSQDYDLGLRLLERINPERIRHIPHVLYHWRTHEGSAGLLSASVGKPYAVNSAERALSEHLQRSGVRASVAKDHSFVVGYRTHYALPDRPPLVSIIVPTRNRLDLLRTCIGSILEKTQYPDYEIIVVDNDSDDAETLAYLDYLEKRGLLRTVRFPGVFNHSAMNNRAAEVARGEVLCLLNNDVEVINETWLTEMVSHALRPEIGAVGASLWQEDGTLQHGGIRLCGRDRGPSHFFKGIGKRHLRHFRAHVVQNVSAVTGACLVVRKEVFREVKGFEQKWLPVGLNDVDLCLKIRELGLRNLWTPYAELFHLEKQSRGEEPRTALKLWRQYLTVRWLETLDREPSYNPNLHLDNHFMLADPPRVNLVKTLRHYAQADEPKLLFIHIPKTAGCSLRELLEQEYPWTGTLVVGGRTLLQGYEGEHRARDRVNEYLREAGILFSHFSFGIHEWLDIPSRHYLTVLRDPCERVISHYNHLVGLDGSPLDHPELREMSLADMLEKQIIPPNLMTRKIAGERPEQVTWAEIENGRCAYAGGYVGFHFPPEVWKGNTQDILDLPRRPAMNDPALLDTAWDNMQRHFYFIGLMERLPEMLRVLGHRLGWDMHPDIPQINTNNNKRLSQVDDETRALIEEYNHLDRKLYEQVSGLPDGHFIMDHPA